MNMTDGDIAASFRQAKDQKKQVQVLADLNGVSRREMEEKLHQLGLAPKPKPRPEKRCHTRPPDFDELLAMELYNDGKSDLVIAEQLGVAKWKFGEWRRDRALPANRKVPEKKETPPPETKKKAGSAKRSGCLVLADLIGLLEALRKDVPEAEILLGSGKMVGVDVSVAYGLDGKRGKTTVTLRGDADAV